MFVDRIQELMRSALRFWYEARLKLEFGMRAFLHDQIGHQSCGPLGLAYQGLQEVCVKSVLLLIWRVVLILVSCSQQRIGLGYTSRPQELGSLLLPRNRYCWKRKRCKCMGPWPWPCERLLGGSSCSQEVQFPLWPPVVRRFTVHCLSLTRGTFNLMIKQGHGEDRP